MGHRYYNSASATPTTPFDTSSTAAVALADILGTTVAANEIIFAKNTSSESLTVATTYTSPTAAVGNALQKVISVSDFTTVPPVTVSTGATIQGGNIKLTLSGNWYFSGTHLLMGSTAGTTANIQLHTATSPGTIIIEDCYLGMHSSSTNGGAIPIRFGPSTPAATNDSYRTILNNVSLTYYSTGQISKIGSGEHIFNNCSIVGAAPTTLFDSSAGNIYILKITNSDLSGVAWTNLLDISILSQGKIYLENVKIPSGANLTTGTCSQHNELEAVNVASTSTSIAYYKINYSGNILSQSSIYATTSPLTNAGTPISHLMTTSTNCSTLTPLTKEYLIPVASGVTKTPFIEVLVQGSGAAALTNADLYIEAEAMTTTSSTKGTRVTSFPGYIAATSNCSAGTTAWTGDGYATERTHRLTTSSLTTTQSGFIRIRVCVTKPSVALYVGAVGVV